MRYNQSADAPAEPALSRLVALAPITSDGLQLLRQASQHPRLVKTQREIFSEGTATGGPLLLLSGWACRIHNFRDGRRQIIGFVLPGDLLGQSRQSNPIALTSMVALTDVTLCAVPAEEPNWATNGLREAFAVSAAFDEYHLLRQITRLGRLSALERIVDWLLELHERLTKSGLASRNSFPLPITQEIIADTLGLTGVHVNRTLQALRRDGLLEVKGGMVTLLDQQRLTSLIDHGRPKVADD